MNPETATLKELISYTIEKLDAYDKVRGNEIPWYNKINLETLDMCTENYCVIGQT